MIKIKNGDVFLFQGDSITDAYRVKEDPFDLGLGYPALIANAIREKCPDITFYNRGVAGEKTGDLVKRWREDCINLSPTVMTLLIGGNDVLVDLTKEGGRPVSDDVFEQNLISLIKDCPAENIIILSTFLIAPSVFYKNFGEDKRERVKDLPAKLRITKRVAEGFGIPYIDLEALFEKVRKTVPEETLSEDGLHPTAEGHKYIADALLSVLEIC